MKTIKNVYHLFIAILANIRYGFPARRITVIGVTGTDGKTTTASFIHQLLIRLGARSSLISTVGASIGGTVYDVGFHVTNPSPFPLQRFISQACRHGDEYLVLEVTSHGIDQHRIWGIPFAVSVLTNITREHLDYHGSFASYADTKIRFLLSAPIAVANENDPLYEIILNKALRKGCRVMGYKEASVSMPRAIHGAYNRANLAAAVAAIEVLGLGGENIAKHFAGLTLPKGRMETVVQSPVRGIVDFAHTPNSFATVLPEIRATTQTRLIHVFGCAGKRDTGKRPLMGNSSARFADVIILTAEDPRDEPVEEINRAIIAGFVDKKANIYGLSESAKIYKSNKKIIIRGLTVFQFIRREDAIHFAARIALPGDTILCTGKSHEESMNYGRGEEPWDEITTLHHALRHIK